MEDMGGFDRRQVRSPRPVSLRLPRHPLCRALLARRASLSDDTMGRKRIPSIAVDTGQLSRSMTQSYLDRHLHARARALRERRDPSRAGREKCRARDAVLARSEKVNPDGLVAGRERPVAARGIGQFFTFSPFFVLTSTLATSLSLLEHCVLRSTRCCSGGQSLLLSACRCWSYCSLPRR